MSISKQPTISRFVHQKVYPRNFQLNPVPVPLGDGLLQEHVGDALGHLDAGQLPRGRVLGAIIYFECGWK